MTDTARRIDAGVQGWESQGKITLAAEVEEIQQEEQEQDLPETEALHPPEYTRSPRRYIACPAEEVKLEPPPQKPNLPTTSIISVLLPALGVIASIAVAVFGRSSGGSIPVYAFVSAPMMLISIGFGIWNWKQARSKYAAENALRTQIYTQYIADQRTYLTGLADQQSRASLLPNPAPEECQERVERSLQSDEAASVKPGLLWEREPGQPDFIHLRLGLGTQRCTFHVEEPPKQPMALHKDELLQQGKDLADAFQTLNRLPVLLKLNEVGAVGIVGSRTEDQVAQARALLMQIVTHHAPSEVKIVLVSRRSDIAQWRWARWLPHIWSDNRKERYFLTDKPRSAAAAERTILGELENLLQQRRMQAEERHDDEQKGQPAQQPVYIFVFADRQIWNGPAAAPYGPFLDLLLREGRRLGAYAIFLAGRRSRVPKACGAVIELRHSASENKTTGELEIVGPLPELNAFEPDLPDLATATRLADALAPVRLDEVIASEQIPASTTLADAFGVEKISDVDVKALWSDPAKQANLTLFTPLGLKAGRKRAEINLQQAGVPPVTTERAPGQKIEHPAGYGAHAMIGGTTGTGKTKFLQTMIVSMCAHYSPEALNFVLIDYKGGDLAIGLEKLPHLVGSLANVEGQGHQTELIQRLFTSIDVEILRRKNLLKGRQINEYLMECRTTGEPPLPHLFIVIDEFAEMIQKNPSDDPNKNIMKRLLSIAAIGRSIGIHLILATQNPGTVVGEDLRNNITTRICLRMGTRDASKAMLNRNDAFEKISKDQVGRAYVQVGNNDVFELIQVAYGGAKDIPPGERPPWEVSRVTDWGERVKQPKDKAKEKKYKEQLETLVELILKAGEGCAAQQPVWLPMLKESIDMETVRPADSPGWDGKGWQAGATWLEPVIGQMDAPGRRQQPPLRLPLDSSGHLLVFGSQGNGKTTLLQTLVVSLAMDHNPREVQFYMLDFGGKNLKLLEALPHTGAVITSAETERLRRLFTYLGRQMEYRKTLLGEALLKRMSDYREQFSACAPADLFVVLDNFAGFNEQFNGAPEMVMLKTLAGEGAALGIHLVVTHNSASFPMALSDKFNLVVTLGMNKRDDYMQTIGRTGGLFPAEGVVGRGLVRLHGIYEFQVAQIGQGDETNRSHWVQELAGQMCEAWQSAPESVFPQPIPPLPPFVRMDQALQCDRPPMPDFNVTLGINLSEPALDRWSLNTNTHYWIVGSPLSGRTTLLRNWLTALAHRYSPEELLFFLIDPDENGLNRLAQLPNTLQAVCEITAQTNLQEIYQDSLLWWLNAHPGITPPSVIVAIDDLTTFRQRITTAPKPANVDFLAGLAKLKTQHPSTSARFLLAGTVSDFPTSGALAVCEEVKKRKNGIVMAGLDSSSTSNLSSYLAVKIPSVEANRPVFPGLAFAFQRGVMQPVWLANDPCETLP